MNAFTAVALPLGAVIAGALYGLALMTLNRLINSGAAHLAGRLSGLPTLVAPLGCDDCSVEDGEPHRYAGCPGNVRQCARQIGERT